jgi:hypothetical protein
MEVIQKIVSLVTTGTQNLIDKKKRMILQDPLMDTSPNNLEKRIIRNATRITMETISPRNLKQKMFLLSQYLNPEKQRPSTNLDFTLP